jgi:hypothetical protein
MGSSFGGFLSLTKVGSPTATRLPVDHECRLSGETVEKVAVRLCREVSGVSSPLTGVRERFVGRSERSIFLASELKNHRATFSTVSTHKRPSLSPNKCPLRNAEPPFTGDSHSRKVQPNRGGHFNSELPNLPHGRKTGFRPSKSNVQIDATTSALISKAD